VVRFQLASDGAQSEDGFYFDDLQINVVEESVLTVSDAAENAFIVYPNPVKNTLYISTQLEGYEIALYNLQGQLITSSVGSERTTQLDYSFLSSGMYVLKLTADNASKTLRLVKE